MSDATDSMRLALGSLRLASQILQGAAEGYAPTAADAWKSCHQVASAAAVLGGQIQVVEATERMTEALARIEAALAPTGQLQ